MLYNQIISNYADFKEKFGNKESRNNKIALAYMMVTMRLRFKNRTAKTFCSTPLTNREVYERMKETLNYTCSSDYKLAFINVYLPRCSRMIDVRQGLTEDGDTQVRYILNDNHDRPKKMKIGKFLRAVFEESKFFAHLPESCINYFCEQATTEWEANHPALQEYELRVDEDFGEIYSSDNMAGDFGSCMTDDGQYSFYVDAVSAKAASLWQDGKMYARCVIFTDVHDLHTGKVLRLAERQYAVGKNPVLKQILINKLIEDGEIDGYKKIDACYFDAQKFHLNDGTEIYDHDLWIECNLEDGDIKSYQDSFKWYDYDSKRAYNYEEDDADFVLSDCDRYYERPLRMLNYYRWDGSGYHLYEEDEEWVYDNCVEINGDFYDDWYTDHNSEYIRCDEARYSQRENEYYHEDDAVYCEWLEDYIYHEYATWCEEMEDYLPIDDYEEIFQEWKKQNWCYDEVNDEYVYDAISVYVYDAEIGKWVCKDTNVDCRNEYTKINEDYYRTEQLTQYYDNYEVA